MLSLLTVVHAACVLVAIGAGIKLVRELLTGDISRKWFVRFLKCTLIGDIIGVLFPFDGHLLSIRPLCMISVFMSGMVILSWRCFHAKGLWRAIFASNLAIVFGMDIQILLCHFLKYTLPLTGLSLSKTYATTFLIENVVTLAYSALALVAVARFRVKNA